MTLLKHFLIYSVCAATVAIAVYAAGGKCVSCNNYDTCNNPLNTSVVNTTCTLQDNQVCGMYSYNDTQGRTTARGCVNNSISCEDVKKPINTIIKDTWACYKCTGELCNKKSSGNNFGVPMVAMVLGAMISLNFK